MAPLVVGLGLFSVRRIAAGSHLAEQTKCVGLVAMLLVRASQLERPLSEVCGVVEPPHGEIHLGERDGPEQMVGDQPHRGGLVSDLAQQRNGLLRLDGSISDRLQEALHADRLRLVAVEPGVTPPITATFAPPMPTVL